MDHRFVDTAHVERAQLSQTFGDSIDDCRISVPRPLRLLHESQGAVDGQRVDVLADEVVDSRSRGPARHPLANVRGR
jgi:hypothetical protein